ncbi:MAG: metalloprotease family protein [Candidatus Aenigmatarchaeota archaeon]
MEFRKLLNIITFPGIIIHEFGHKIFCDLLKVRVEKVCYFRFGEPLGYVIHERPKSFHQSLFIVLGPFIVGSLFAIIFYLYSDFYEDIIWKLIFIWLGFSSAYNCFPSSSDAKILWKETNRHIKKDAFALLGYPFSLIIWLQNKMMWLYLDVIYAVAVYFFV